MGSLSLTDPPDKQSKKLIQSLLSILGKHESLPNLLNQLRMIFGADRHRVYLVGGAVRDIACGRPVKDLDFVVRDGAIALAFQVADRLGVPAYPLDSERDSGRIVLEGKGNYLDITSYRGQTLKEDLRDRDFTINAMAIPIIANSLDALIDPCGGSLDINNRLIKQTHESAISSDPVRAMRAVRLALDLDFSISKDTEFAITAALPKLNKSSIERYRDELLKILELPQPDEALRLVKRTGLLAELLPEIDCLKGIEQGSPHHEDVLSHTQSALHNLVVIEKILAGDSKFSDPRLINASDILSGNSSQLDVHFSRPVLGGINGRLLLRLSTLFHDAGKAETRVIDSNGRVRFIGHEQVGSKLTVKALQRLKMSNEASNYASSIVAGHMRPLLLAREPKLTKRAIYRYFRDLGRAGLDCCILALADHLAINDVSTADKHWSQLLGVVSELIDYYYFRYEDSITATPLLSGKNLISLLEIEPGPYIGELLRMLAEAQAIGEIKTQDDAIKRAHRALKDDRFNQGQGDEA
jgi:tRNA nucleotidyltransferase/poly(A) polymerase